MLRRILAAWLIVAQLLWAASPLRGEAILPLGSSSGAGGSTVSSVTGTEGILANGNSGTAETGAITLSLNDALAAIGALSPAADRLLYWVNGTTAGNATVGEGLTFSSGTLNAKVPHMCEGRLTLTSGTAVTVGDVTGATNVYFTPYGGNRISLYTGSAWEIVEFAETTEALGTLTSGLNYDVFGYNNGGTLDLEKVAWTNDTTRATALVLQDGVLVKSGATTRRFLGTFRTTSTTATEDSVTKRFLSNYYNRQTRGMKKLGSDTTLTTITRSDVTDSKCEFLTQGDQSVTGWTQVKFRSQDASGGWTATLYMEDQSAADLADTAFGFAADDNGLDRPGVLLHFFQPAAGYRYIMCSVEINVAKQTLFGAPTTRLMVEN